MFYVKQIFAPIWRFVMSVTLVTVITLLTFTHMTLAVGIEASADPQEVYQGEVVMLTIRVSDFEDGMTPDLDRLPPAAVTLQGQSDQSFQNISIINGKMQRSGFSGRLFQYRVIPTHPGTYALGPISLHGAKSTNIAGPTVTVRPIPQQDTVLLFLEPSKTSVVLEESFSVNLRVLIRRLKAPYSDVSPLTGNAPPHLTLPYLEQNSTDGLDSENIQDRLNAMLISSGEGFAMNSFALNGSPFDGFFAMQNQQRPARFRFNRSEVTYQDNAYYEYVFPMQYTPQREGTYSFGPIIFKGQVFVGASQQGEGITETVYAIADAVTVQATPPPLKNRPDSYIGAIGTNLTVTATLDTQTCYMGDPLSLEIEIGGNIRLNNVTAPHLSSQKSLHHDFKIYEDTVQRESRRNSLLYRFTVRPIRAGTLEFPPIAVTYYDTLHSSYETLWTEPIPVRANAVTEVQGDIVINTDNRSMTISAASDANGSLTPAPVRMAQNLAAVEPFLIPRLHIPLLLIGPLLVLGLKAFHLLLRLLPLILKFRTQRSAAGIALKELNALLTEGENQKIVFHRRISDSLRSYLRAQFGASVNAATPTECEKMLTGRHMDVELAKRFALCLETHTNTAFAGAPAVATANETFSSEEATRNAMALIREIDDTLRLQNKTHRYHRSAFTATTLTLLLTLCFAVHAVRAGNLDAFESQRAMTSLITASRPEAFTAAANAFEPLIQQGAANGDLFYNYGTARLMAGEYSAALNAFYRAERYSGTTWDLKRNIALALRGLNADNPVALPWYRVPLFWHYGLPTQTRMTIASLAFSAVWLLFLLRRTRLREIATIIAWIAASLFFIFSASVLSSAYEEHHAGLSLERNVETAPDQGGDTV